jgi:hypothetical protein
MVCGVADNGWNGAVPWGLQRQRVCGHKYHQPRPACVQFQQTNTPPRCLTHKPNTDHRQMPLLPSSQPSLSSGPDYHRLPASEEEEDATQSPPPCLPPLPPLPAHDVNAAPPPPESPWALLGRTSDANDEDEDEVEREALHLPPPAPLLPWTTVQTPVTRGGGAQPHEDDDQSKRQRRCQQWLWLLPRFLMMPPSIFRWLPGYSKRRLWGDLLGGLTVAVMVIPQGNSFYIVCGQSLLYPVGVCVYVDDSRVPSAVPPALFVVGFCYCYESAPTSTTHTNHTPSLSPPDQRHELRGPRRAPPRLRPLLCPGRPAHLYPSRHFAPSLHRVRRRLGREGGGEGGGEGREYYPPSTSPSSVVLLFFAPAAILSLIH